MENFAHNFSVMAQLLSGKDVSEYDNLMYLDVYNLKHTKCLDDSFAVSQKKAIKLKILFVWKWVGYAGMCHFLIAESEVLSNLLTYHTVGEWK